MHAKRIEMLFLSVLLCTLAIISIAGTASAAPQHNIVSFNPATGGSSASLTITPNPAHTTQSVTITATCTGSSFNNFCAIYYPNKNTLLAFGSGTATYSYPVGSLSAGTYKYYYAYSFSTGTYSVGQALVVLNPGAPTNAASNTASNSASNTASNTASNSASNTASNSASSATPPPLSAPQPIQACTLYGNSNYTNNWLSINYLVIIIGFMIIAVLYAIGRVLPPSTRSKIVGMTKVEMTQLLISVLIIVMLMFFSGAACNISASVSQQLTGTTLGPFTYADYYIGNLSTNTGLRLLTNIYSDAISFSIDARVYSYMASQLANGVTVPKIEIAPGIWFSVIEGYDLSTGYYLIADLYMDLFSPILVITIGMLFLQYLALPLIRLTAFVLILTCCNNSQVCSIYRRWRE
ncbi:conserved hypothetical protein, membrane, partial [mine drainage metagenome]